MRSSWKVLCSLIALLAVIAAMPPTAYAQETVRNGDKVYLEIYQEYLRAEQQERNGKSAEALEKYKEVLKALRSFREKYPDWQQSVVQYRVDQAQKSIARLEADKKNLVAEVVPPEGQLPTRDRAPTTPDQGPIISMGTPEPTPETDSTDGDTSTRGKVNDLNRQIRELKADLRDEEERRLTAEANEKSARVAVDRIKVEKVELKSQTDQLKEALANAKKDSAQRDKSGDNNAQELAKLQDSYRKMLVENEVLEDKYASAFAKLERAAKYIGASDDIRTTLTKDKSEAEKQKEAALKEKAEAERKLKGIKDNAKELERIAAENKALAEKLSATEKKLKTAAGDTKEMERLTVESKDLAEKLAASEKKLKTAENDTKELEKISSENKTLTEKLAAAEKKTKTSADNAKDVERLSAENKTLSTKLADAEKKISELATAGPEKDKVISDLQSEVNSVKDQLVTTQAQLQQKDVRLADLEKQLDQTAGELASVRLNPMPSTEEKRAIEENEMLRGIVLRQLKEQARRAQVRKLIEEEVQRLQVKSTVLDEQLTALSNENLLQTSEEKALFKEPQIMLVDTPDHSVTATVAVVKPDAPAPDGETASTSSSSLPNPDALPAELEPLIKKAKELFAQGNFAEANKVYLKVIEMAPDNYYALANYGVTEFQLGRFSAAEVALRKATTVNPEDSFAYSVLGLVYFKQARLDEAIQTLNKAVEVNPKDYSAHNHLGITFSNKGDTGAAIDEIGKALELNPNYADAHFNLAVIYATAQPPNQALAKHHYDKAIFLGAPPDNVLGRLIQEVSASPKPTPSLTKKK